MEVRSARYEDLDAIEEAASWACSAAIGDMVPEGVVAAELAQRFRKSVLCEHLLTRRLLIGVGDAGRTELVALIEEHDDYTSLTTVVVPAHPSGHMDGRPFVTVLRSMGWSGPLSSSAALGDTVHEGFHESAGFVPGDVVVDEVSGHEVYRREWWLGPTLSATG